MDPARWAVLVPIRRGAARLERIVTALIISALECKRVKPEDQKKLDLHARRKAVGEPADLYRVIRQGRLLVSIC